MLTMHIAEAHQGAMIMPLFIVLASVIGLYITRDISLILWSLTALSLHAFSLLLAKRAAKQDITADNIQHWKNVFLGMQILTGFAWAMFALAEPTRHDPTLILFFKGSTLLIALSLTAIANFMLRRAISLTFLPVLAALGMTAAISRNPFDVGLALMFGMAILFCHRITNRLYQTSVKLLSSQTEKDDLIAELEVANSVSDESAASRGGGQPRQIPLSSPPCRTNCAHRSTPPSASPRSCRRRYSVGSTTRSTRNIPAISTAPASICSISSTKSSTCRASRPGRYDLNEESISMLEIAEDCIGMIQLRARAKNIRISQQFRSQPAAGLGR